MIEIDRTLQNPRRIESFNEDDFMKAVMEEIDKRLKRSLFKEKDTKIELLTNKVKEKETLAYELQKENSDLNKGLTQKQAEIEKISRQCWRSSTRNARYGYCAAIDIGSSYSGYAFSAYDGYTKEPTKINTTTWCGRQLLTLKAPTAVLLDSSQEFVAFGYDAENKYSELLADEEHEDYHYFHSFKMLLYERQIAKGTKLQSQFVHSQQSNITWWCQRGRTIQQSIAWLKANLDTEIQLIGDIWLFVWIGTCNLTSIDKNTRYISLSSFDNTEIIQQITQGYKEIINLLAKYPNCRVTFLETPFYSIINWNTKQHHKDPSVFSEQEHSLEQQVIALNKEVKAINTSLHSHSPDFNYDLYRTSKYKSSKHKGSRKQRVFNIALY
ncbi:unnamed protein product [Mytilus edulis]|uniref:Uncharacterized protein n=1 Tax=Mytilus edulis TaxID=6550 RepID=A0A8S3T2Q9_MYTED|nr:unnamed protein product [Mytilus edulis]